tara:strand:- start:18965 stop:19426 length:462 start_codon:yes stop_codon:yes gene_type:complete
MKLSNEGQEALEFIREKISAKNSVMSSNEADCLGLVYKEIQEFYNVKVSHIIDRSCNSCLMQALKIVYNYITYHEIKPIDREAKVIEVSGNISESKPYMGGIKTIMPLGKDFSELTHTELRTALKNAKKENPLIEIPKNANKETMIKLLNENK